MMNNTTPTAGALDALRAATTERHELLDTGLPLAGPAPTLDDYRSHLRMLRAWLAPYRWGVAYVAEGSQLGGAVLCQRLSAQLAPHPLAYLRGEAAGPGPRWRSFMLALKENVRGEEEVADACAGARDAFARILALR